MDTFYAWTDTDVEIPLASLLLPGTYTISLDLNDPEEGARAEAAAIPLVVVAPAAADRAEGGTPELPAVNQRPGRADVGSEPWAIVGLVSLLSVAAVGLATTLVLRRRRGIARRR
jgi:hypothetical protein